MPSWSSLTKALPLPVRDDGADGRALPPANRGHKQSLMHEDKNKGTSPTIQQGVEAGSALSSALGTAGGKLKAGLMTSAEICSLSEVDFCP